jgi:tetratricopeptide (TPR) repeat protein
MLLRYRDDIIPFAIVISVLTILAYSNTFQSPFVFDDVINIVENASLSNSPSLLTILTPPKGTGVAGRPLINLSLAFNYAISGERTWSYHLFNLIVHILTALTLLGIIRRTLLSDRLKETYGNISTPFAFACALLWAIHPLQTESVTYIIQRCESLMGLFFLLTFYCSIRGWQSDSPQPWHLAAILAFLAGVVSKEVIVAAPVLLFFYDLIYFHKNPPKVLRHSPLLYSGLLVGLISLLFLVTAGGTSSSGTGHLVFTPTDYWITQPRVIIHYILLSFWPYPLCIDYGWPVSTLADEWPFLMIMALISITSIYALFRLPSVGFLTLWFFFLLAPTSLMPLPDLAFEHRMYLPLAAIVVMTVGGAYRLLRFAAAHWCIAKRNENKMIFKGALYLLFLSAASLMILTFSRNLDYETDVALWSNTVRQYPENSRARVNLGSALIQRMRYNEGLPHLQESLRIETKNASHFAERFPGSGQQIDKYLYYLSIRSVYAFARYNLGTAYLFSGKPDLAIENFTETLRFRPQYHSAHTSLGIALYMKGNQLEAFRSLRQAIDLKPDDSTSHTNLGAAFRLSGNAPEALKHFSEALRLKPNNPDAHYGMGLTLLPLGRHQESALHLREAARLNRARTARFENLMLP